MRERERERQNERKRDKKKEGGTSLVVQCLKLADPNAGGLGLTLGQGTRSHMPQLRVCVPRQKILCAAAKTPYLLYLGPSAAK